MRGAPSALRSGWGRAAIVAAGVLALVYLLNLPLAWLQAEATPRLLPFAEGAVANPIASPGIAKAALLSLMLWHGISLRAEVALPTDAQVPFGFSIEVSVVITLMLGLATAGYLLYRGGRWATEGEGPGWQAGVRGLQIALLYAVLVLILSFLGGVDVPLPEAPGGDGPESVSVGVSKLGAFGMPFVIAALAASAGALSGRLWPRGRTARLVLGGISGGWRAAWMAVALATMGFLVVAALNPDETRAYLELVPGGGLARTLLVLSTVLILPNIGTGIAAAAMGGSINLAAGTESCAIVSYLQFPGGVVEPGPGFSTSNLACGLPIDLGPAPFQYLLFLLVPLAATIAGGWLAAQRAGATEAEDGAVSGATIAIPYALWLGAFALVARFGASTSFFVAVSEGWVGPGLVSTLLIAIVWGALGGAIGGALGARNASGPGLNPGPPTNV
jgi:hypothetical protein